MLDSDETKFLENLSVSKTTDLSWASGDVFSIYCSQPIPEPMRIYETVQRYLAESGSRFSIEEVLNGGGLFEIFADYASSNAYLLTTGPKELHSLVAAALNRQGVAYSTNTRPVRRRSRLYVTLAHSWFFCETATAEW